MSFQVYNKKIPLYNLSKKDLQDIDEQIQRNKDFLNNTFVYSSKGSIPLTALTHTIYNNKIAYISQKVNQINSFCEYYENKGFIPIMVTLTLPSSYHYGKIKNGKVVENPSYSGATPLQSAKKLTKMLASIRYLRSYRDYNNGFFRTVEPHKDGTPHTHCLFYINPIAYDNFIKDLKALYKEPLMKIDLNVKNAVAYVAKYLYKTFYDDINNDKNGLSLVDKWFIHNKIMRFSISRGFIPLYIYKKIYQKGTLLELSQKYSDGLIRAVKNDNGVLQTVYLEGELIYQKTDTFVARKDKKFLFSTLALFDLLQSCNTYEQINVFDEFDNLVGAYFKTDTINKYYYFDEFDMQEYDFYMENRDFISDLEEQIDF